ncbi:Succinyl-CoA ligase [ADP-forming] alpha chain [hydrothermal vent metagenome]|uniref:Succinyl-CoA ligase [ADP-forming] alpha chain n=1 Tax=hydrothermal vent metagenome TaxID=652676 RepID=A0A3B1BJ52_9ZZZZ
MSSLTSAGKRSQIPRGVAAFEHYYVGIDSLDQIANKDDRVCVLNISGGESRTVTPVSHVYSGGNIVCGTMPGRSGTIMKTKAGDIPVYSNVAEAMDAGHKFNVAVVYVPPSGVKDSVIEAVRVNPEIDKVVILTEKVPLSDSRIIRQYCQQQGVDVFGANCLGIADAHKHIRIGGALGGNAPEESLVPGSVALFSNSGNFTTTIATYLLTAGWGTTVSVSSGKDVYIHFSAPEFTNAFHNDDRSKAAVMYIEPGGYYEHDIELKKPVVACIVGRWKSKLTRACGHAGAIAGSGDNAEAKEKWFMDKFGVDEIYTPENPVVSAKGAVVINIAHIPEALTAVMAQNDAQPDFAPRGDLSMKPWFSSDLDIGLPADLDQPMVTAMEPYNTQIAALAKQVGVVFPRQTLKDASGASMMDPKTQVSRLQGVSVLDASTHTFEDNLVLSLAREYPDANGSALANVVLNAYVNQADEITVAAADAARAAGNSPNTVLSSALAIIGPNKVAGAKAAAAALKDLFGQSGLNDSSDAAFDVTAIVERAAAGDAADVLLADSASTRSEGMLAAIKARGISSVFIRALEALAKSTGKAVTEDAITAAVGCHVTWKALMHKRVSVTTLVNMAWHLRIFSTLVGSSAPGDKQEAGSFCGISDQELMESWSFTETAHLALLGTKPNESELFALTILLGLLTTNGPGTISGQGAKGAVSADGPEVPDRVQVNKSYIGFLTHTGYAHGGNGYEAMAFLMEQFKETGLKDPGDANHGLDLAGMALAYAKEYKDYKTQAKAAGNLSYAKIPCINHPVFKGKDVNYDPREVFVNDLFKGQGQYNIFLDYYHNMVEALCKTGVSKNVYCVNVDAVIAVILLKMLWQPYADGKISENQLESAAFTTFLYGRMIGSAAEIDDHTNRGRNMDTRTPASKVTYVG